MTNREPVHASIRRDGFDALPWQFDLTSRAAERLKALLGAEDLYAAIGDHMSYDYVDGGSHSMHRDEYDAFWAILSPFIATG